MTKIVELFGIPTNKSPVDGWEPVVSAQSCPYLGRKCNKVRKSQPEIAIGTCSVRHGKENRRILICPNRLLEQNKVFADCVHLLSLHETGNQLHLLPEISIPGGSVDYFLVSVKSGQIMDFVGIELQTMDTTGTVWPERQRFLERAGLAVDQADADSQRRFGMNWKMTAKTTLVQLHHKVESFEILNKRLVIVMQDELLSYLRREFQFDHLQQAQIEDSVHFHSYSVPDTAGVEDLVLNESVSTDASGIAKSLGLRANARIEPATLSHQIEERISNDNILILPVSDSNRPT